MQSWELVVFCRGGATLIPSPTERVETGKSGFLGDGEYQGESGFLGDGEYQGEVLLATASLDETVRVWKREVHGVKATPRVEVQLENDH
ncbi:hypothetical protein T484DRAFT_1769745 [Baffinella frigidus]|nr:hypothetical protein T484DRAFT_1769745 [Cryptophyta sp. CCMP2293]